MTCRACIQLSLDVNGIYDIIDTQMTKNPHDILVHLTALESGRNPDISTLKKHRGVIFSECCAESFKTELLHYVNEVLFKMVKTALKDACLGVTTTTTL